MRFRWTVRGANEPAHQAVDWATLHRLDDAGRIEEYKRYCSWPSLYYESTAWMLKIAGVKRFVEVGVAYGYHAQHLIAEIPDLSYTGVDPYLPSYDPSDAFDADVARLFDCEPVEAMDRLHGAVSASVDSHQGGDSRLVREPSVDASTQFADASLDAVFVDGNHLADAVSADIAAWFPKLRRGGILLGDDYQWPSVSAAWDEAFKGAARRDMQFIENQASGYRTVVARKP
jgi:predicted O-methyltransferase YrrM